MLNKDFQDVLAGALVGAIGLFVAIYAYLSYSIGSLNRLGPGGFPFGLGVIMAVLGVIIIVPALTRQGKPLQYELRTPFIILASLGVFALTVRSFGLVPAIFGLVIVSSLADRPIRPVSITLSCVVLSLMGYLIFRVGLGLPLNMFNWPF